MELDAAYVTTTLAKTTIERLNIRQHGKCWSCGQIGHVRKKCPTKPLNPFSISAIDEKEAQHEESGKDNA